MKILVVEDEKKLAELLKAGLQKEGYAVDCLFDGEAGQRRIEIHHNDYDVVVLDLMMPKKSGFDVCREVRAKGISVPILVLTARSATADKISLLDLGADDYLVKPFSLKELLARIRALTRRPKTALPKILEAGLLKINPAKIKAYYRDRELDLTLKEFRILEYLMRNLNQALARDQILDKIWDFEFDSFSNVVDVHIRNLRKKLGEGGKLLETVRGVGYRLKGQG